MKVTISITKNFKNEAKPLLKKFHSLGKDLEKLEAELLENPRLGTSLGFDAYKIRLKITSKRKGKSGGGRVITLLETDIIGIAESVSETVTTVNLLSIFDKSDTETISDSELKDLIKNFRQNKK